MAPPDLNALLRAGWDCESRGDFAGAEQRYRQVLDADPNHAPALNSLGSLALLLNHPQPAAALLERALARDPQNVDYQVNFGSALRMLRRFDEALLWARRAVALRPDFSATHTLLAALLMDLHQMDDALAACQRALQIDPKSLQALHALQAIHGMMLRPREVIAAADRTLALHPNDLHTHWNKARAALLVGDFKTGWTEWEWRTGFGNLHRDFPQPQWNHQDLAGKTILLHCEGGAGDAIHFVRYLPLVRERAGTVLLECPQALGELFRLMPDAPPVILRGQPLPAFDYHCSLSSLPLNFDTRLETIPAAVPYLRADPKKSAEFAARVGSEKLRVGLAWAGSPLPNDTRSRRLETFAPLFEVPGIRFFGLQVGPDAAQCAPPVQDLSPHIHDFADLAAAMANMDLVISVDTAVAHLAGALAKKVWTLITYVPDFRWMLDRADSPWYPTMRLYRQTSRSDWREPVAEMARDLAGSSR